MNAITRWALMALLALPHLAQAEIYKWVDERGVTTYGNRPPRGVAGITRMNGAEPRVSIVPAPRSRLPEATRGREPEARIARFEGDAGPAGFAAAPLPASRPRPAGASAASPSIAWTAPRPPRPPTT